MIWAIVLAAIALAGLVMVVCYAVWLAHKASDVFAELRVVGDRLGQLAELAAQISFPEPRLDPDVTADQDETIVATNDVR